MMSPFFSDHNQSSQQIQIPRNLDVLPTIGNTISPLYTKVQQISKKDIELIQDESIKLRSFLLGIEKIIGEISIYRQQCQKAYDLLGQRIQQLLQHISQPLDENLKQQSQSQILYKIKVKQRLLKQEWQKRISISKTINVKELRRINLEDRYSKANQLFKLILFVFYNEPIAKYYWPNFKEQAFCNDDGEDFKLRMGHIDASMVRQQQKCFIEKFLEEQSEICNSIEFKRFKQQVSKLCWIIQSFHSNLIKIEEIHLLKQKIRNDQFIQSQQFSQMSRQKLRVQALSNRQSTMKQYLTLLDSISERLNDKAILYHDKIQIVGKLTQQMKRREIAIEDEVEEKASSQHCECQLF